MSELLAKVATRHVKPSYTEVKVGDTVRVYTRIKEGDKERTQYFEGLVIRRRGGIGPNGSFTVRRLASGIGVERTFPLHSPLIERIQIQRGAKVRRATLYTMRGLTGKAARLTEQPVKQADRDTEHPWPKRYGVEGSEVEAVEETATKEQLKEEQAEGEAAKAEEGTPSDQADKKPAENSQADDAAKSEKTQKEAKEESKDKPSKEVKDAAKQGAPVAEKTKQKETAKTEADKADAKKGGGEAS